MKICKHEWLKVKELKNVPQKNYYKKLSNKENHCKKCQEFATYFPLNCTTGTWSCLAKQFPEYIDIDEINIDM